MIIYVGNLQYKLTEGELEELFAEFGSVSSARVIADKYSGRSKGFGFVEMPNQEEAEEAVRQLEGKEVNGRNIKVNEAKRREERWSFLSEEI
jgi:RNA recognition motif-containing protein